MTVRRFRYRAVVPAELDLAVAGAHRTPHADDLDALASLMLDAYEGTIDYHGETLADARAEVLGYFSARARLDLSVVRIVDGVIASACLVSELGEAGAPLVAYIMTARASKRRGLAREALALTLSRLRDAGYEQATATITDGNTASERLFASFGFRRIEAPR